LKKTAIGSEILNYHHICLSAKSSLKLFCFQNCRCFGKKSKLKKLIKVGLERMEKDMNIERLIKNLRNIKIFFKLSQFLNNEDKFKIQYNHKNVINLDSDENNNSDEDVLTKIKRKAQRTTTVEPISSLQMREL